jgi:hypothetical protein
MEVVDDLHWTIRACRGNREAQTKLAKTLGNIIEKYPIVNGESSHIACMLAWSIYACKGNEAAQRILLDKFIFWEPPIDLGNTSKYDAVFDSYVQAFASYDDYYCKSQVTPDQNHAQLESREIVVKE